MVGASKSQAFLVLIRGPLGVGKSTVSERLAERLGGEYISIDQILEEKELWVEGLVAEFLAANRFAADRAESSLASGDPVVVDGNFYWEAQIEDLIHRIPYPAYVFTLEAPVEVCVERDARRDHSYGEEATKAVYAKTTRFGWGSGIDATRPPERIVAEILSRLPQH